jgi:hypothetical protein
MTHAREHDRSHRFHDTSEADLDPTPCRTTRSSRLDAPAHPIASGLILRRARNANGVAGDADQAVAAASGNSGSALPETLMRKFEASLGTDLSGVRVHAGNDSAAAAHAVGAQAYTVGQDIHFGTGYYDPSSSRGEHLLAHEVAHTVQQRGGTPRHQNKLEVSAPHDAAEYEADRAADAMVAGAPAVVLSARGLARRVDPNLDQSSPLNAGALLTPAYPGALLGQCPSLPRRTRDPAFLTLASSYAGYQTGHGDWATWSGKLTELQAYAPPSVDLSAITSAVAKPGNADAQALQAQTDAMKTAALGIQNIQIDISHGQVQIDSAQQHLQAATAQLELYKDEDKLKQLVKDKDKLKDAPISDALKGLSSTVVDVLVAISTGGAGELAKISTMIALHDQANPATGGTSPAAARAAVAEDAMAGLAGSILPILDKVVAWATGVDGAKKKLQQQIDQLGDKIDKSRLNPVNQEIDAWKRDITELDRYLRLKLQLQQQAEAQLRTLKQHRLQLLDKMTKGAVSDIQAHEKTCDEIQRSGLAFKERGQALVGALGSLPAATPAANQAPVAPPANDPSSQNTPPPAQAPQDPGDPVPASLASEASALSASVTAELQPIDATVQAAVAKRATLEASIGAVEQAADTAR